MYLNERLSQRFGPTLSGFRHLQEGALFDELLFISICGGPSMPITVRCPKCQAGYRIPDDKAGRALRCKKCGAGFTASERSTDANLADPWDETVIGPSNLPAPARQLPAPVRRTKGGTGGSRSKRSSTSGDSGSGTQTTLLVTVGAIAFVVFAVGSFFAVQAILSRGGTPAAAPAAATAEQPTSPTPDQVTPKSEPAVSNSEAGTAAKSPAVPPKISSHLVPAALYVPASKKVVDIEPPPEGVLETLEAMTAESLSERMREMEKEELEERATNRGGEMVLSKGSNFRDESTGLVIQESVTRTITEDGEQTRGSWRFEQATPKYVGQFVSGNFVDPRVSGQGARGDTGAKQRQGMWALRYEDGTPRARGTYQAGRRHGVFTFWGPDGSRLWGGLYTDGELVRGSLLDEDDDPLSGQAVILQHEAPVTAVSFSRDGTRLATGDIQGHVRIWSSETWEELTRTQVDSAVSGLAFSPADGLLAVAQNSFSNGRQGQMSFWRMSDALAESGSERSLPITGMFFAQNGKTLVTRVGISYPSLLAWDVETRSLSKAPPMQGGSYAFSTDRKQIAVQNSNRIVLLDGEDLRVLSTSDPIDISSLRHSLAGDYQSQITFLDKTRLLVRTSDGAFIQNLKTGTRRRPAELRVLGMNDSLCAGHGSRVITDIHWEYGSEWDGISELFERPDGFVLWDLQQLRVDGVFLPPQGLRPYMDTMLASDTHDLEAFKVSPDGAVVVAHMYEIMHTERGAVHTRDNNNLDMAVWDLGTGRRHVLSGHSSSVLAVAFSPDGRYLATGSSDFSCVLWDLEQLRSASRQSPSTGNAPPEIELTLHKTSGLMEGDFVAGRLSVYDSDGDELTYFYRIGVEHEWRPAWDGWILAYPLPPGEFELQARAVDEHGAEALASVPLKVEPNRYAHWEVIAEATIESSDAPSIVVTDRSVVAYGGEYDSPSLRIWTLPDLNPVNLTNEHQYFRRVHGRVAVNGDGTLVAVTGLEGEDYR